MLSPKLLGRGGGGGARPNAKLQGEYSISNIYMVGGYVNHSRKREDELLSILRKICGSGSAVEGVR